METINITVLPPKEKHLSIVHQFDLLKTGESFAILSDHDPKPLYQQLVELKGETFNWEYLDNESEKWQVKITKLQDNKELNSIADIVIADPRKVAVFKKYGLDFCCGGKNTLNEACAKKGIDVVEVEKELSILNKESNINSEECDRWDLDVLVDYILTKHHSYVKESIPEIQQLTSKIANVHGDRHPELEEVYFHFNRIGDELNMHMNKEEVILFPYIKELQETKNVMSAIQPPPFGTINNPIRMMELEHKSAGEEFENIKRLTNNYTVPDDACNSYMVTFNFLREFEEDLHRHIHLENNILFPKAIKLEEELLSEVL